MHTHIIRGSAVRNVPCVHHDHASISKQRGLEKAHQEKVSSNEGSGTVLIIRREQYSPRISRIPVWATYLINCKEHQESVL